MIPKHLTTWMLVILLGFGLNGHAQDFKLYFANNITDVQELNPDIDKMHELVWREVESSNTQDIAGNLVEVEEVMKMFDSDRMKWLEDQQQFWRMRDHCLLCFRIDNCGKPGDFRVEVTGGRKEKVELTVSRTFFVNVNRGEKPVEIKVSRVGDEENFIDFKYYVFDWNDANLYTFQLDHKRQVTGEEYSLEYMLAWTDSSGNYQTETKELKLKSTAFQSFYVPEGKDLVDVLLKTGNTGGEHKLRLNMKRLHPGVTTDPDFEAVKLRSDFKLDKHEDRELVNFNWIGTGLYERFDTLFLTVFNNKNELVTRATINANAVDENGNSVDEIKLRNLGYDSKRKAFKVLTYGNPAYIEVIAAGMCPALYKYPGAADPFTHIVDEARCLGELRLFAQPKSSGSQGIIMSAAHLKALNDTKKVTRRWEKDYQICDINDIDITFKAKADTLVFFDDNGNNWPKLLNEEEVAHYAKLELSFSSPKAQALTGVSLTATEVKDGTTHLGRWPEENVIRAADYKALQRDYYYLIYDLTEIIPDNKYCRLELTTSGMKYDDFPCLMSARVDRGELKKTVEDKVNNDVASDKTTDGTRAMGDAGFELKMPISFKFNVQPLTIKQSFTFDLLKQTVTSSTTATYNRGGMLEPGEKRPDESDQISEMRKEAKEYAGATDIQQGDKKDPGSYKMSVIADDTKFDDWVQKEMDEIFTTDVQRIGQGWFGSFKMVFSMGMGPKLFDPKGGLQVQNCSGTIGYGLGFMVPDLLDKYLGQGSFATLLKEIPSFKIGANFELSAQLDLGVKKLNDKYQMSVYEPCDNFGYFAMLSGKFKAGAWMEVSTPPNPLIVLNAGLRAGMKAGLGIGIANRFEASLPDFGGYLMGLLGLEAYARVKTFFGSAGARATLTHGARCFFPQNDGHNPLHPKYPWWITDRDKKSAHAINTREVKPVDAAFGEPIVTDVAYDANPHFLSDSLVVYNDAANPEDSNDDCITLLNTNTGTRTSLSQAGVPASRHMRSKRGEHEIVVFEQLARPVQPQEVSGRHAMRKAMRVVEEQSQLMATVRKGNGAWKTMAITSADGYVDSKPVVTMQDDGHAACIWQRGRVKEIAPIEEGDTIYNMAFDGNLVMSFYDGQQWSKPVNLISVNENRSAAHYDLMMRNDSVLVGISLANYPLDPTRYTREFKFASIKGGTDRVNIVNDPMNPQRFFMNRVGQHAVIAMLYEKNDSTRDIFVKTMKMSGYGDGIAGNDIGANYCSPNLVKIICDRSADEQNHFAILWTEMSNTVRGDSTELHDEKVKTMLNASRISLRPVPHVTYPLTVGGEIDTLSMVDFDGFLDDSRIKVVYSLADVKNGGGILMTNEKYFSNSFQYEVAYTRKALLGSSTLPVSFIVRNTGTSPIMNVKATVNGQEFNISDSYVAPCHERTFVVKYPITADFDGYLSTTASVEYDNLFRVNHHPKRRAMSFKRQQKSSSATFIDYEDVECRLVGHSVEDGVNSFVVELIDHSSRGFYGNEAICVGIYPHPGILEPVSSTAEVIVRPEDFIEIGGTNRAYATVKVSGVKESTRAYLNIHTFNASLTGESHNDKIIPNVRDNENAHYVTLLPAGDPAEIEKIREDIAKNGSKVSVKTEENGVRVSGLKKGDRLRVFSSNGILMYSCKVESSSQFVPLRGHDVYLLSSGQEIHKFSY